MLTNDEESGLNVFNFRRRNHTQSGYFLGTRNSICLGQTNPCDQDDDLCILNNDLNHTPFQSSQVIKRSQSTTNGVKRKQTAQHPTSAHPRKYQAYSSTPTSHKQFASRGHQSKSKLAGRRGSPVLGGQQPEGNKLLSACSMYN